MVSANAASANRVNHARKRCGESVVSVRFRGKYFHTIAMQQMASNSTTWKVGKKSVKGTAGDFAAPHTKKSRKNKADRVMAFCLSEKMFKADIPQLSSNMFYLLVIFKRS